MKRIQHHFFLFCLIFLVGFVLTCSKDSTDPQETPPALPPLSSFIMDFESFPTGGGEVLGKGNAGILQTKENWGWAATNVLVWNTVLFVNLAVPVAAFGAALQHDPYKEDDGSWSWAYGFNALNTPHTAKLNLSLNNNLANWKMYISKEGEFSEFLWYEGQGDLGYSHGTWTLYKDPTLPVAYLGMEWNRNPQDETGDIRYTLINDDDPNKGSYIHFGTMDETRYDAYYTVYHKVPDNYTYIEWERVTKAGRVADLIHYENEEWHCWDETLFDVECPN
jgi:hypothetical protein